jgi:uncharacterized protein Yka (UPF0111/DUF47 family)
MGIEKFVRWILPKEDQFYNLLEQQASVGHEAALALSKFRETSAVAAVIREAVQDIEHKGDDLVHQMEDALARTFVTPIDREDIHKLSSELDDVLDFINLSMRACVLFGLEHPTEPMVKLIDILVNCTDVVKKAIPLLRTHEYGALIEASRTIRRLEKDGDAVFRGAVSVLFHDPQVDAKVLLREKEILEDLENAVDACDHLAETLANIAVKHG